MKKNQANQPSNTKSSGRIGKYTVGAAVAMLAGMGVFAVSDESVPATDAAKLASAMPAAAATAQPAAPGNPGSDTRSPFTQQQGLPVAASTTLPSGAAVLSKPASAKERLADFERMEMPARVSRCRLQLGLQPIQRARLHEPASERLRLEHRQGPMQVHPMAASSARLHRSQR